MADTTNAGHAPKFLECRCEFCGATTTVPTDDLSANRVACESCRARVKWCPTCDGATTVEGRPCPRCWGDGTDPKLGCQKIGDAFCEESEDVICGSCTARAREHSADQDFERQREQRFESRWVL